MSEIIFNNFLTKNFMKKITKSRKYSKQPKMSVPFVELIVSQLVSGDDCSRADCLLNFPPLYSGFVEAA